MIHWSEPGMRSLCGVDGESTYDEDLATCPECLFHLIQEALADRPGPEGSLEALELCRRLAEVQNPHLKIVTLVGRTPAEALTS